MNVEAYRARYSKDCPRVELEADNAEAAQLLGFLTDERLRPLAPAMFDALCGDFSGEDRVTIMQRAQAALSDPGVMAIMHPEPAEPSED